MDTKQKLGPLQQEWIRCLRSGEFPQGEGFLVGNADGNVAPGQPYPHCCLGIVCRVAQANGLKLRWIPSDHGYGDSKVYEIDDGEGRNDQELPPKVMKTLRFRDSVGRFKSCPKNCNEQKYLRVGEAGHVESLADANDQGCTFVQIADFVEAHPEEVFEGPA